MSKYCGKCGGQLDDKTGLCPNCDADKLAEKKRSGANDETSYQPNASDYRKPVKLTRKQKKAIKKANRTTTQKVRSVLIKVLVILLAVLVLISGGSILLAYNHLIDIPLLNVFTNQSNNGDETGGSEEQYTVPAPDAEEYYENNSKVLSKISAKDSEKVTTEKETIDLLKKRGFKDFPIITNYDMEGEYIDGKKISESSTKHPSYETYYQTKDGNLWTVFVVDGAVMANPVFYNFQSKLNAQVIISERDSVVSYDGTKNTFYETIPNKSELIIKKVKIINTETLEGLDVEGIDKI